MHFPLYNELRDEVQNTTMAPDWKTLVLLIHQLSQEHLEILFVLIYHHWQEENTSKRAALPYHGKYLTEAKKGVIYQIHQLPVLLQNIIAKYIERVTIPTK